MFIAVAKKDVKIDAIRSHGGSDYKSGCTLFLEPELQWPQLTTNFTGARRTFPSVEQAYMMY